MANYCGTNPGTITLPTDPSNDMQVRARGLFGGIEVTWTLPNINPHAVSFVRIYRATSAEPIPEQPYRKISGDVFFDTLDDTREYYYWVQWVSVNGTEGDLNGPASAIARPPLQSMLEQLANQIGTSQLTQNLKEELERIDSLSYDLQSEIAARLSSYDSLMAALADTQTQATDTNALVLEERQLRENAYSALVEAINGAYAESFNNNALILEEQRVRAEHDEALGEQVEAILASNVTTYRQAQEPDSAEQPLAENDLWINLADPDFPVYQWDGTQWLPVSPTNLAGAFASIEAEQRARVSSTGQLAQNLEALEASLGRKAQIFFLPSPPANVPANDIRVDDIWFDTDNQNLMHRWDGTDWVATEGSGGVQIFRKAEEPTAENEGDLWFDLTDNDAVYRWNGEEWEPLELITTNRMTAAIRDNNQTMVGYCSIDGALASEYTEPSSCLAAGGRWLAATPLAEAVKTVQITDGTQSASIEERMLAQQNDLNELSAQYTLKLDSNGHIAGYGIAINPDGEGEATSQFIINADTFALVKPGEIDTPIVPFSATEVDGEYVFTFDGRISISQLSSGPLADNTALTVGDGSLIIEGSNPNKPGSITIAGPGGIAGNDYVFMSNRELQYYRYVEGIGHVADKALKRRESGVANNGETVILPGYWSSPPEILVSPNRLPTYVAEFAGQDQAWAFRADELTDLGNGKYSFRALAELQLGDASGSENLSLRSGSTSTNTWNSAQVSTPANTQSFTVHVRFTSQRGNPDAANSYYKRRVRWRVAYRSSPSGSFSYTSYRTKNIGNTLGEVTDAVTVTPSNSGTWYYRIECIAEDAGGTFTTGSQPTQTVTRQASGPITSTTDSGFGMEDQVEAKVLDLGSYSPPTGWEIYRVDYDADVAYYIPGDNRVNNVGAYFSPSTGFDSNNRVTLQFFGDYGGTAARGDYNLNNWYNYNDDNTVYYRYAKLQTRNARGALRNARARIRLRQLGTSGTLNSFELSRHDYNLTSAQMLREGTLNWVAIGD